MYLEKLSLVNFKNISSQSFDFQEKINCFVGANGVGKTNVLDAIYYLSFAKSYFNPIASQNIKHGEAFFMIEGSYLRNERAEKILCSLKKGQKKVLKRNGAAYEKFSEHIGQLPLVIISPADRNLIVEGSDTRRKFIDGVISQQDKAYLQDLIAYNKLISQRNALLKYFALNRVFDPVNLKVYDDQLCVFGQRIYTKRAAFLTKFTPIFNEKHAIISGGKETVNLVYKSQLHAQSLETLFEENNARDRLLQYTSAGVHKDDLSFEIDGYPIKKFGSQGQQKSYLIALKLAQFEFIKQQSKVIPLLLLDDIFDKLDAHRVTQIIDLVNNNAFGQIFITDTHASRTEEVLQSTHKEYQIFNLDTPS